VFSHLKARRVAAATGAVVAVGAFGGIAWAATSHHHHHSNPLTTIARRALLHQADLGYGWRSAPAPKKVPTLTCPSFSPSVVGIAKPGAAASPTFRRTSIGPFISQAAYVYATRAQALRFWHRVVTRKLVACVGTSLTAGSTQSVSFAVDSEHQLPLPAIGDRRAGYRVIGHATTNAQQLRVYLDMLVVGRGAGLTQISFSSFSKPAPRSLEVRLARLVAGRLPQDKAGASTG
jgi:hypothetical protein